MEKALSERIWIIRYFMVIGIVFLHVPPYQSIYDLGDSYSELVIAFFSHGIFKATVPLLTVISGYLIFNYGLHLKPLKLFKKKVASLLVPLLIWNLPFILAIYIVQKYYPMFTFSDIQYYPFEFLSWCNSLFGFSAPPANYPLMFLRDLFVLSMLSPIVWVVLKSIPKLGVILVCIIYFYNLDNQLIWRDSMLINFYFGAFIACYKIPVNYLDKYSPVFLAVFILACIMIVAFDIDNIEWFRIVSPFFVWPAMLFITENKIGKVLFKYSAASFCTFLIHNPLLFALWIIFNKMFSNTPYIYFWIFSPIVVIILANSIYMVSNRYFPQLSNVVFGGR